MYSLNHNPENDSQWRFYKQLELVPDSTPAPTPSTVTLGISCLWRSLVSLLLDELVHEQRIDYLERCWTIDQSESGTPSRRLWQQFLTLIE